MWRGNEKQNDVVTRQRKKRCSDYNHGAKGHGGGEGRGGKKGKRGSSYCMAAKYMSLYQSTLSREKEHTMNDSLESGFIRNTA